MAVDTTDFANREAVRYVEEALQIPIRVLTVDDLKRDLENARRAAAYERMNAALDALA